MQSDRIHILRVTEQAVLGGEQTDVLHLLSKLDPDCYAQTACSEPLGPFVDEVRRMDISHIPVEMRGRFDLRAVLQLRRIIRKGNYDIVHLHGARAGLLGRIAARLAGAPLIVWTMHIFQPDILQGWRRWQVPLYLLVEGLLARYFSGHIIAVSEDLRQRTVALEHVPPQKISTIYSDIDLCQFEHSADGTVKRGELGLPLNAPVVCTVGRLCEQKGLPDFLRAAAYVHAEMADVKFLVVGDGPMAIELKAMADRLGLNGCLAFAGHRSDVPELLFASDLFATATHWEGFGKVNVEAMAAGKPLVATNVGPIPEVIGDYRAAILVPPRDPAAFAKGILTILRELPAYARQAQEDRHRALVRFSGDSLARQTAALYEQLVVARWPERAVLFDNNRDGVS